LYRGAVPRCGFITSISSVYITRSAPIDSPWWQGDGRAEGKKNGEFSPREVSIKNNNSPAWRAVFSGAEQQRGNIASTARDRRSDENFIPFIRVNTTAGRSINTRTHYQKMGMAVGGAIDARSIFKARKQCGATIKTPVTIY